MHSSKKIEWELYVERKYSLLSFSLVDYVTNKKKSRRYVNHDFEDKFLTYSDHVYIPKGNSVLQMEEQKRRAKEIGFKYWFDMAKNCENEGSALIELSKTSAEKGKSAKSVEIADTLAKILEAFRDYAIYLSLVRDLEDYFEEETQRLVSEKTQGKIDEKEKIEIYKTLSAPIKFNATQKEQLSLFKIAADMPNMISADAIYRHLQNYSWIQVRGLLGMPLSIEDIEARISKIRTKNTMEQVLEKISEMESQSERNRADTEKIFEKFTFSSNEIEYVWLLKEFVYLRTHRTDVINEASFNLIPLIKQAAAKLGISYDEALLLSCTELIQSLRQGEVLTQVDFEKRKEFWILYRENENVMIIQGKDDAKTFLDEQGFKQSDYSRFSEIKGKMAFGGKITGRAKILFSPSEVGKIEAGDILIAIMTFPSFIMAMEKAAAFVTDEGGILCHAAIISREMRKPCVIGTKIATKVFKDGDMVEVDADKGVVRLLYRDKK